MKYKSINLFSYPEIHWNFISKKKNTKELIFIHTPKCAGSYVKKIIYDLQIPLNGPGHRRAKKINPKIAFTVFRDPIKRFESFLNYRLSRSPSDRWGRTWPSHLTYVYNDTTISLNEIVAQLTDKQILGFVPFKTLVFWYKNIDIVITIDQLYSFLLFFGYTYDKDIYSKENESIKIRGTFSDETIQRLKRTYKKDIILYNTLFPNNPIL